MTTSTSRFLISSSSAVRPTPTCHHRPPPGFDVGERVAVLPQDRVLMLEQFIRADAQSDRTLLPADLPKVLDRAPGSESKQLSIQSGKPRDGTESGQRFSRPGTLSFERPCRANRREHPAQVQFATAHPIRAVEGGSDNRDRSSASNAAREHLGHSVRTGPSDSELDALEDDI